MYPSVFSTLHHKFGILSVAAAGNGGNSAKSYPASFPGYVSIAVVNSNDVRASIFQYNDAVELSGPGFDVKSVHANSGGTSLLLSRELPWLRLMYQGWRRYYIIHFPSQVQLKSAQRWRGLHWTKALKGAISSTAGHCPSKSSL